MSATFFLRWWNKALMMKKERMVDLLWSVESKQWPCGLFPSDQTFFVQLLSCLLFPPSSFVTSSVTFPRCFPRSGSSQTSVREHIVDRGMEVITSSCLEEVLYSPESLDRSPGQWSWLNYWAGLIGSLSRQDVTLKAVLPVLSALCVAPINLSFLPCALPFYVQLKPWFK